MGRFKTAITGNISTSPKRSDGQRRSKTATPFWVICSGSKETSRAVAARAAQKTGLGEGLLKQLLPVVAAMAMGSLSKQTKEPNVASALAGMLGGSPQQGGSSAGLGDLLGGLLGGGQKQQAAPQAGALGMLGGLLDADGDGNAMDDIFQMVMTRR